MPIHDLPFSDAAERNKDPILEVLDRLLPGAARVLEIASGTGQHAAHFAAARPDWDWQPSDADPNRLPVIAQRCAGLPNVRPPRAVDVLAAGWPLARAAFDALLCVNMLHVAHWSACAGLMRGAAQHLADGGQLVTYGPYLVDGESTAPSNLAFDADLRARDPSWGLRRLGEVVLEAERFGLRWVERVPMPANNQMIVFRSTGPTASPESSAR